MSYSTEIGYVLLRYTFFVKSQHSFFLVDLTKHQRRVGLVLWHPSAQNILLSAGSDNNVVIWNVGTGEALICFALPDLVYSGCWNWDGSEVLFTCKDRKIRRVDPRFGKLIIHNNANAKF